MKAAVMVALFYLCIFVLSLYGYSAAHGSILSCNYPDFLEQRSGVTIHYPCEIPCLVDPQPLAWISDSVLCPPVPVGQVFCLAQWRNVADPANVYTVAPWPYRLLDGNPVHP